MAIAFDLAAALGLLAMCLLCYATLQGYRFSIRPLLKGLGGMIVAFTAPFPVIRNVGRWLDNEIAAVDNAVLAGLRFGVTSSEHALVALWNGTGELMKLIADEIKGLALDTEYALVHVNKLGRRALSRLVILVAGRLVAQLRRQILSVFHSTAVSVERRLGALRREALHDIAAAEARIGRTAKQARALARQLRLLRWLAGITSVATLGALIFKRLGLGWLTRYKTLGALGLAILARLGLRWLRCNNVGKAGRQLCGLDPSYLDELLLDTVAILGAVSIVEFAHDLQDVTDESVAIMRGFIREF